MQAWGGCLLPRPQGIVELTLFLDCLAHPVSLPGDRATSIHLEGLPRGRVNRWLSPLEQWVFRGGKVTCAPNLDSKSLPNKGTGHSGIYKNSCHLVPPPTSDIFGVGLRHKGCIYHHLRPSSLWLGLLVYKVYRPRPVFRRTQRVIRFPFESLRRVL